MHVSRYPHNISLGEVEFKVLKKLLAGNELTEEEETRADQMSRTLQQNEQGLSKQPHRHRVPSNQNDFQESSEVSEMQMEEQLAD